MNVFDVKVTTPPPPTAAAAALATQVCRYVANHRRSGSVPTPGDILPFSGPLKMSAMPRFFVSFLQITDGKRSLSKGAHVRFSEDSSAAAAAGSSETAAAG